MQNFNKEEEERKVGGCSLILRSSFAHPSLMVRLRFVYGRDEKAGTSETGATGGTGETGGTSATGETGRRNEKAGKNGKNGNDW